MPDDNINSKDKLSINSKSDLNSQSDPSTRRKEADDFLKQLIDEEEAENYYNNSHFSIIIPNGNLNNNIDDQFNNIEFKEIESSEYIINTLAPIFGDLELLNNNIFHGIPVSILFDIRSFNPNKGSCGSYRGKDNLQELVTHDFNCTTRIDNSFNYYEDKAGGLLACISHKDNKYLHGFSKDRSCAQEIYDNEGKLISHQRDKDCGLPQYIDPSKYHSDKSCGLPTANIPFGPPNYLDFDCGMGNSLNGTVEIPKASEYQDTYCQLQNDGDICDVTQGMANDSHNCGTWNTLRNYTNEDTKCGMTDDSRVKPDNDCGGIDRGSSFGQMGSEDNDCGSTLQTGEGTGDGIVSRDSDCGSAASTLVGDGTNAKHSDSDCSLDIGAGHKYGDSGCHEVGVGGFYMSDKMEKED